MDIVLVEDNPTDVELTLDALKRHNLANRVKVLRDGAEALDYVFGTGIYSGREMSKHPRIILLDLKLPKVDGLEVLRRIRSDERTRLIPVVVLTSSDQDYDRIESYRLGVNSYIVKPVEFENFAGAVAGIGFYWVLMNKAPC
ncbi:MAG: response regulator [Syntrophales bacterium]